MKSALRVENGYYLGGSDLSGLFKVATVQGSSGSGGHYFTLTDVPSYTTLVGVLPFPTGQYSSYIANGWALVNDSSFLPDLRVRTESEIPADVTIDFKVMYIE